MNFTGEISVHRQEAAGDPDSVNMRSEEHRAAGDRADAMMQAFKRQIAEKVREK